MLAQLRSSQQFDLVPFATLHSAEQDGHFIEPSTSEATLLGTLALTLGDIGKVWRRFDRQCLRPHFLFHFLGVICLVTTVVPGGLMSLVLP